MQDITFRHDITALARKCRDGIRPIAIAVITSLVLAGTYLMLRRPVYTANASVMIASDLTASGGAMSLVRQFSLGSMLGGSGSVHDELSMISSHTTLRDAIKKLGSNTTYILRESLLSRSVIYPHSPILMSCAPSIPDTLSTTLSFKLSVDSKGLASVKAKRSFHTVGEVVGNFPLTVSTPYGEFSFTAVDSVFPLKMDIRFTGYSRAAEELAQKLTVDIPSKLADVVALSYESPNRELATDMLQTLIDQYNMRGVETKRTRDSQTLSFIDERLARLTGELNDSEEDIERFKKHNRVSDVQVEAEYMLGERAAVDQELLKAETDSRILQLTREFIENPDNSLNFIPLLGLKDGDATSTITDYNNLIIKRIELEKSARSGNPALQRLNDQIDVMRDAVRSSVIRAHENALVAVDRFSAKARSSRSKLDAFPTQERTFRDIKRRQTVQEQLMIFLMEQREETALNMVNTMGRGQIVDEPYILTIDTERSPLAVLAIAFFFGLLVMPVWWYFSALYSRQNK